MKSIFLAAAVCAGLCFAGCTSPRLADGEYRIAASGRGDFIAVYQDLIFVKVRNPDLSSGVENYWHWAGKYALSDNGEIRFDMDKELEEKWRPLFNFSKRNDGISLMDFTAHRRYLFFQRIPQSDNNAAPAEMR